MFRKIASAMLVFGFVTSAHAQSRDLSTRILQLSDRVSKIARSNAQRLDPQSQQQVLIQLENAEHLLLQASNYPPMPPRADYETSLRGEIGGYTFDFKVKSLTDTYEQCGAFLNKYSLYSADRLSASVNFGPTESVTSQTLSSRPEICLQLVTVAQRYGIPDFSDKSLFIGLIEDYVFKFESASYADLNSQCENFITKYSLYNVSTIKLSINFQPLRVLKGSWQNKFSICQQILQAR